MVGDLFGSENPEIIRAQGASLTFFRHVEFPVPSRDLLERLIAETPWRQETITVWGKKHLQPRLVCWYGEPGKQYRYSGITLSPLPWTNTLVMLKSKVEALANSTFNSVLLNYYRDGNDSMGFHSDDEPELGVRPTIASLSFGEERTFVLKEKLGACPDIRLDLGSGSLLLMRGDTQQNWKHGIGKSARVLAPRVNLTFRTIFST